ncbi:ankyrin-1-like isoform X2 [Chiloscyllium plagiosum]|uniref:ankyrin-1-like isoform X2 n=1 Tax=Chiloscyllium plagiosum TaxID=36176 RepID=UPI001CB7E0F8|nr:ankyrin-1-like isoform X2 [Chiloscyllium plagiosum]
MLSPASLHYTMPSPLQADHFWNDVTNLDGLALARPGTEPLLELSDTAHPAWSLGPRPPLVVAEDSSLDCSRAEDSLLPGSLPVAEEEDSLETDPINGLIEIFNQEMEAATGRGGTAASPALSTGNGICVVAGRPESNAARTGSPTPRGDAQEWPGMSTASSRDSGRTVLTDSGSLTVAEGGLTQAEAWKARKEWARQPEWARLRVTQEKLVQPVQDQARLQSLRRRQPEGSENPLGLSPSGVSGSDPRSSWITLEEEEVLGSGEEELDRELGEGETSSDDEEIVTTRVVRRRLIVKGEEAKNIPGESVREEQFTDEDGNLVTKKIVRKVVRRVTPAEGKEETVEILHQEPASSENQPDNLAKYGVFVRDSTSRKGSARTTQP